MSTGLHDDLIPPDLSDGIRRAFAEAADGVPEGAGARVRAHHYRPRRSALSHTVGATAAVATLGLGALVAGQLVGHGDGSPAAAPGASAAPTTTVTNQQLAAYVAKAMSATTDVYHATWTSPGDPKGERWASPDGTRLHLREYAADGSVVGEVGYVMHASQVETTTVDYRAHTVDVSTQTLPADSGSGQSLADQGFAAVKNAVSGPTSPAGIAGLLKSGAYTKTGTTTVDGRAAYELSSTSGDITATIAVDEQSNLPVSVRLSGGGADLNVAIEWLPPTADNVALETVTPPKGFTRG